MRIGYVQSAECYIFLPFIKTVLSLNLVFISTLHVRLCSFSQCLMFITFYVFDSGFLLNCTSTEIVLKVLKINANTRLIVLNRKYHLCIRHKY